MPRWRRDVTSGTQKSGYSEKICFEFSEFIFLGGEVRILISMAVENVRLLKPVISQQKVSVLLFPRTTTPSQFTSGTTHNSLPFRCYRHLSGFGTVRLRTTALKVFGFQSGVTAAAAVNCSCHVAMAVVQVRCGSVSVRVTTRVNNRNSVCVCDRSLNISSAVDRSSSQSGKQNGHYSLCSKKYHPHHSPPLWNLILYRGNTVESEYISIKGKETD